MSQIKRLWANKKTGKNHFSVSFNIICFFEMTISHKIRMACCLKTATRKIDKLIKNNKYAKR